MQSLKKPTIFTFCLLQKRKEGRKKEKEKRIKYSKKQWSPAFSIYWACVFLILSVIRYLNYSLRGEGGTIERLNDYTRSLHTSEWVETSFFKSFSQKNHSSCILHCHHHRAEKLIAKLDSKCIVITLSWYAILLLLHTVTYTRHTPPPKKKMVHAGPWFVEWYAWTFQFYEKLCGSCPLEMGSGGI